MKHASQRAGGHTALSRTATGIALLVVVTVGIARDATAQESARPDVGPTAWALPGLGRVGVPAPARRRAAVAAQGGYGFTEELKSEGAGHHRVFVSAAGSVRPLRWLAIALRLDGRYDNHPRDERGDDSGWTGVPRLAIRGGEQLLPGLSLGGQLAATFWGGQAPSIKPEATTLDVDAMLSYALANIGLVWTFRAGYRLDQSAKSVRSPGRLRQGDRIALQISDSDAVRLGTGVLYRVGALEVWLEGTWDVLVGSDAPSAVESPLRFAAGARYNVVRRLQLGAKIEGVASQRPDFGPDQPLVPIEPRIRVAATLGYRFPFDTEDEGDVPEKTEPKRPSPKPKPKPKPEPEPEPQRRTIEGRVVDPQGQGIAGAEVRIDVASFERTTLTQSDGRYSFELVPSTKGRIVVTATDFKRAGTRLPAGGENLEQKPITLQPKIPRGELRGLIRSFGGDPLNATIRIEPQEASSHAEPTRTQTDAEGMFSVDLPEGSYDVRIKAEGYRTQDRKVEIDEDGVTVLNAELRRAP